jgi:4'-phosphopantetheinyl transferase
MSRPTPDAGTLHLWHASLDRPAAGHEGLLSADELERAERFHFARDRRRFVVGRGILRALLGAYLDTAPEAVQLRYGASGKPALADGPLRFNLSHSGAVALFAFTTEGEVGVDVEELLPQPDARRLADHFFSPAEVATLRAVPAAALDRGFLECWTRKEAFVKARGDGLSLPLDAFDVTFGPGRRCALVRTAWAPEEAGQWSLVDVSDPAGGYVAAVATSGAELRIEHRTLDCTISPEPHLTLRR